MPNLSVWTCVVAMVVGSAWGQTTAPPKRPLPGVVRMDGVAAYVNGAPITISDIIRTSRELQSLVSAAGVSGAQLNAAYSNALAGVMATKIVVSAYDGQQKLVIPDAAIDERLDVIIDEQFSGDRVALAEALTREGLSLDSWREQVREGIILQTMRGQYVERHVRVTPAEVKAAFAEHGAELARPGRVKLRMIVVPAADGTGLLADAQKRLASGESFETVAMEVSTGTYASKGGDRGWMELPDLRDELREAVDGLATNQVSEPVKAGTKIYLLKVEGVEAGQTATFEDVAGILERKLRADASNRLFREWVAALREDVYVRIVEEAPF
jgi:peptidyl-prolyl cis-trans isomerase SurA